MAAAVTEAAGRPVVLFGSTFTERLSAAPHLYDSIAADIAAGERYWLFRAGDGEDTATGSHRWFIHGVFG